MSCFPTSTCPRVLPKQPWLASARRAKPKRVQRKKPRLPMRLRPTRLYTMTGVCSTAPPPLRPCAQSRLAKPQLAHETAQVGLGEAARVQLGLNRWGTVVRVSCAGANLQQAVQDLGLFGLPYEDALARLMEDEAVLSELSGAEGLLVVVESPNQSQEQDVLSGCRRVAEGASCKAMCRSARQRTGAGMGGGHGQGHGAGAGNGRGQGSGCGNGGPGSGGRNEREG